MDWLVVLRRFKTLRTRFAVPGWVLITLSILNAWDLIEFTWEKAQEYGVIHFASSTSGLFIFGILWLTALILWPSPPKLVEASTNAKEERVASLLRQAAAKLREPLPGPVTFENVGRHTLSYLRALDLMDDVFMRSSEAKTLVDDYINSERAKHEAADVTFDSHGTMADAIEYVAGRVSQFELDTGFHMPESFLQYREAKSWPHNTRIKKTAP